MTVFSWLFIPSFLARFARMLGVCLLALAVVAGRAATPDDDMAAPLSSAQALFEQAPADEPVADGLLVAADAPGESHDRSSDASEEEESDEGDQQVEEALQTRASLWLACSSYELTFHSNDKGMCRCLQVDPGPARV